MLLILEYVYNNKKWEVADVGPCDVSEIGLVQLRKLMINIVLPCKVAYILWFLCFQGVVMATRGRYGDWTEQELQLAIAAYKNGDCGLNECARVYGVPKATIKRHADSKNAYANEVKSFGRRATFSKDMEDELASYILRFEEILFGLTIKDIRRLVFDIAERHSVPHSFNSETRMAGKKWFYAFMRRNPHLSLRQPEATSMARARGFNKENVDHFFDLLEKTVDEKKITASRIYNVDESGFTTVQKKPQKILARKGKHQVGAIASGERGINTTMVCCVSAAGNYIPPMLIFKRKRKPQELAIGAPAGSVIEISDTGYINSELFVLWLNHFHGCVKSDDSNPVLLLLDGHTTHSKNVAALEFCRENGIILLQLPGHTTHRLQPLDVAFFKPLETYFTQAQETWLRQHVGHTISMFQIAGLLNVAYGRAATVGTAQSAFRATGVWPVNRHIFEDHHFTASEAVCRPVVNDSPMPLTENNEPEQTLSNIGTLCDPESQDNDPTEIEAGTGQKPLNDSRHRFRHHLKEVSPLPKMTECSTSRFRPCRQAQKAEILTSSPYKRRLQLSQSGKKKRLSFGKKSKQVDSTPSKNADVDDWYCVMCDVAVQEDMIQCLGCHTWVHSKCANVKPHIKKFYCVTCV